jgi:predicted N-acyltransferase
MARSLIAGALNLIGSDTLYGRYWGRRDRHGRSCISKSAIIRLSTLRSNADWRCVEAGAQGEHKLIAGVRTDVSRAQPTGSPTADCERPSSDYLDSEREAVEEGDGRAAGVHALPKGRCAPRGRTG